MSVAIPVPGVARFDVRATLAGVPVETSFYFRRLTGPITLIDLQAEATRLASSWRAAMCRQLGADIVWNGIHAEDLSPSTVGSVDAPIAPFISIQTISLPNHVAFRFRPLGPALPRPWQWDFRLYGIPKARVTDNLVDSSWAANMRTFIRDRHTLQGAFGWEWSVVRRVASGVPLAVGIPYEVTGLDIPSAYVSPMRRRLTIP